MMTDRANEWMEKNPDMMGKISTLVQMPPCCARDYLRSMPAHEKVLFMEFWDLLTDAIKETMFGAPS